MHLQSFRRTQDGINTCIRSREKGEKLITANHGLEKNSVDVFKSLILTFSLKSCSEERSYKLKRPRDGEDQLTVLTHRP